MKINIFGSFKETKGNCGLTSKECDGRGMTVRYTVDVEKGSEITKGCKNCPLYVKSTKK